MDIIIQKYGGSSLTDTGIRNKAAEHVVLALKRGSSPVVVVSAMGRAGDPYATDTLIQLANSVGKDPDPGALAFLMACGENISAAVFSLVLRSMKVNAFPVNGSMAGISTTPDHLDAKIKTIRKDNVRKMLKNKGIPVIAGFQGVNDSGEITTLGRGGSDITAVALGAALQASVVEIYTDVSGLMTADPRIVPEARHLNRASYSEILQMAQEGAKVIHPRAVEIAMEFSVPIAIRSTGEGREGTMISNHNDDFHGELQGRRVVSGITCVKGLVQITAEIHCSDMEEKLFQNLAENRIFIDLINLSPGKKIFTIPREREEPVARLLKEMEITYRVRKGVSKIAVIGAGMRGVPGVMSEIISALKGKGIPILQTADSPINISCLVGDEHVAEGVCALHKAFSLGEKVSRKRPEKGEPFGGK